MKGLISVFWKIAVVDIVVQTCGGRHTPAALWRSLHQRWSLLLKCYLFIFHFFGIVSAVVSDIVRHRVVFLVPFRQLWVSGCVLSGFIWRAQFSLLLWLTPRCFCRIGRLWSVPNRAVARFILQRGVVWRCCWFGLIRLKNVLHVIIKLYICCGNAVFGLTLDKYFEVKGIF